MKRAQVIIGRKLNMHERWSTAVGPAHTLSAARSHCAEGMKLGQPLVSNHLSVALFDAALTGLEAKTLLPLRPRRLGSLGLLLRPAEPPIQVREEECAAYRTPRRDYQGQRSHCCAGDGAHGALMGSVEVPSLELKRKKPNRAKVRFLLSA